MNFTISQSCITGCKKKKNTNYIEKDYAIYYKEIMKMCGHSQIKKLTECSSWGKTISQKLILQQYTMSMNVIIIIKKFIQPVHYYKKTRIKRKHINSTTKALWLTLHYSTMAFGWRGTCITNVFYATRSLKTNLIPNYIPKNLAY